MSCPQWCARDHSEDPDGFVYHATRSPDADGVTVTLMLDDPLPWQETAPQPRLMITDYKAAAPAGSLYASAFVSLPEAPHLAAIFGRLGHQKLAALITELVQIGNDTP